MNEKLASAVTTLVVPATILVALLVDRNGISVRMGLLLLAGLVVTGGAAFFGRREVDSPAQALLQTGAENQASDVLRFGAGRTQLAFGLAAMPLTLVEAIASRTFAEALGPQAIYKKRYRLITSHPQAQWNDPQLWRCTRDVSGVEEVSFEDWRGTECRAVVMDDAGSVAPFLGTANSPSGSRMAWTFSTGLRDWEALTAAGATGQGPGESGSVLLHKLRPQAQSHRQFFKSRVAGHPMPPVFLRKHASFESSPEPGAVVEGN